MFTEEQLLTIYLPIDGVKSVKLKLIKKQDNGNWLAETPIGEVELSSSDMKVFEQGKPVFIYNCYDDEELGILFIKHNGDAEECIKLINSDLVDYYHPINVRENNRQIRDYFAKRNAAIEKLYDAYEIETIKSLGIDSSLYNNLSRLLLDGVDPSDIIVYMRSLRVVAVKRGRDAYGMREQDMVGDLNRFNELLKSGVIETLYGFQKHIILS